MNLEGWRERRRRYAQRLREVLSQVVRRLSQLEEVRQIILFGSYARGREDLLTDLDLIVVMETREGFLERLRRIYQMVASSVDMDILCYTPEEFEALKERGFLREALKGGVVIYEKGPS
ncbi:MAG TPA: nucleotidyltransferase domain-containing protein [Armatimonadetes bacterium]|nr:nucleotidyltransferase domain-containing protein [Armatimonadota bacterium]